MLVLPFCLAERWWYGRFDFMHRRGQDDPTHYHHHTARDESGNKFGGREVQVTRTVDTHDQDNTSNHQTHARQNGENKRGREKGREMIRRGALPIVLSSQKRQVMKMAFDYFPPTDGQRTTPDSTAHHLAILSRARHWTLSILSRARC